MGAAMMASGDVVGGYARGGIVSPSDPRLQSPFGKTEIVDGPQIRQLGEKQPVAVVPLTRRKGNRTDVSQVPGLIQKYGFDRIGVR
jgi:hypothetical protein